MRSIPVILISAFLAACAATTPSTYKPHLAVLATELPPSETSVDRASLQGNWAGTATLLRDSAPNRSGGPCSESILVNWTINEDQISGTSVNPVGVISEFAGLVRPDGRYDISRRRPSGATDRVSGWFSEDRAIGYWKSGGRVDYCDFRIDLKKAK